MTENVPTKVAVFDEDSLGAVKSFDDAKALMAHAGVEIVTTDDLGDGFVVLDNKDLLVKVPFIIVDMKFHDGKFGEKFVSMYVVTKDGRKLILNDGGSGIRDQAAKYAAHGRSQGVVCERGLTRSDYDYTDPNTGEQTPATTYYLS